MFATKPDSQAQYTHTQTHAHRQRMPTITVNRKFQTHRVNVGASTLLQDVLRDACAHFKLPFSEQAFTLVTKSGKRVDLSLPFRFANLPQGANLELVGEPSEGAESAKSTVNAESVATMVNIRANVTIEDANGSGNEHDVVTAEFPNDITVRELIARVKQLVRDPTQFGEVVSVQMMMRVMKADTETLDKTLASVGLTSGNHAVRIRVKGATVKATIPIECVVKSDKRAKIAVKEEREPELEAVQDSAQQLESKMEDTAEIDHESTTVFLEKASRVSPSAAADMSMDDKTPSVEQLRAYQAILSQRAAAQPLLTRSLREKLEREAQQEKIALREKQFGGMVKFRIKFSDAKGSVVQIAMDRRKSLRELAATIQAEVLNPKLVEVLQVVDGKENEKNTLFFMLCESMPYREVVGPETNVADLEKSLQSLGLEGRISLLFKLTVAAVATLNGRGAKLALLRTELAALPEAEVSAEVVPETKNSSTRTSTSINGESNINININSKSKAQTVPKWLQLGKGLKR